MNPSRLDECIQTTLAAYPPLAGRSAQLLTARDHHTPTPPGDWIDVTMLVTLITNPPQRHAETTHYGGLITHTHGPVPLGVRPVDAKKLIPCAKAAKNLPKGFRLEQASGELFWPIYPGCDEPLYSFDDGQQHCQVGAYSGRLVHTLEHPRAETPALAGVAN